MTQRVNILRGVGLAAANAVKTQCENGHTLDEANTYIPKNRIRERRCRTCSRDAQRRYRARRAERSLHITELEVA